MPYGMDLSTLAVVILIVMSVFFLINIAAKQIDWNIDQYFEGTVLQPIKPAFDFLRDKSETEVNVSLGLIALAFLMVIAFFSRRS